MKSKTLLAMFLLTSLCVGKPLTDKSGQFGIEIPDDWARYKSKGPSEVWFEPQKGTRVWSTLVEGKSGERPLDTIVESFSKQVTRLGSEVTKVRKIGARANHAAAAVLDVKVKDGWWDVVTLVPGAPGVAAITLRYSAPPDSESEKLVDRLLESFAWGKAE